MRHLRIKMPNSVSIPFSHGKVHEAKGFDETDSLQHAKRAAAFCAATPQAVWIACNNSVDVTFTIEDKVSIPQAVWIACNKEYFGQGDRRSVVSIPQAVWIACNTDNEVPRTAKHVSIPQAVWIACNA